MTGLSFAVILVACGVAVTANSPLTCECSTCTAIPTSNSPPSSVPPPINEDYNWISNIRTGKQGPQGPPGPIGPPGISPEVDYEQIEDFFWSKLLFIEKVRNVYPNAILASNRRAYVASSTTMSWDDAVNYCQNIGAIIVGKELLKNKIRRELRSLLPGKWIGLTDRMTEGVWLWSDEATTEENLITFWDQGEPNGGRNENCAHFAFSDLLNDNECNRVKPVICEIEV